MRTITVLCLANGLALVATPSLAAALPDGIYRCQLYSGSTLMHLGDIAITGNSYQGPAYDGQFEGSYSYERSKKGTINWGGPLGGFDVDGNSVVATVVTGSGESVGFDVTIQLESGNFSTVSCSPE